MQSILPYLILLSIIKCSHASSWPDVDQTMEKTFPNIELSLAPPRHPWPQVAAELGSLEESRESMENALMDRLQRQSSGAVAEARRRIGNIVARMLHVFDDPHMLKSLVLAREESKSPPPMFRQLPQESMHANALSMKVSVLPGNPPDPALQRRIEDIEYQRSAQESREFESAVGDMDTLLSSVLLELEAQIQNIISAIKNKLSFRQSAAGTDFLGKRAEQLPVQSIVRVVPSDVHYPTLVSMVQDMETRRDITETLARKRMLEKDLNFLMLCNSAAKEFLQAAVGRILSQYSMALQAVNHAA